MSGLVSCCLRVLLLLYCYSSARTTHHTTHSLGISVIKRLKLESELKLTLSLGKLFQKFLTRSARKLDVMELLQKCLKILQCLNNVAIHIEPFQTLFIRETSKTPLHFLNMFITIFQVRGPCYRIV